jgi:hypothetical protein
MSGCSNSELIRIDLAYRCMRWNRLSTSDNGTVVVFIDVWNEVGIYVCGSFGKFVKLFWGFLHLSIIGLEIGDRDSLFTLAKNLYITNV